MSYLKFSEVSAHQKPSPLRLRGGEGWVRGQRLRNCRPVRNATRFPLTPTLSPKPRLGEREPTALEAA